MIMFLNVPESTPHTPTSPLRFVVDPQVQRRAPEFSNLTPVHTPGQMAAAIEEKTSITLSFAAAADALDDRGQRAPLPFVQPRFGPQSLLAESRSRQPTIDRNEGEVHVTLSREPWATSGVPRYLYSFIYQGSARSPASPGKRR